ncbi:MAG: CaiB/BaiF CoA transferase family protein [Pseudomonadales bacterium]
MGPLKGLTFIEMAGIGPGPFAGMLFADMGARVIVVDRNSTATAPLPGDCTRRGKESIALNLKSEEGIEALLKLVETADVLYEGFRPGVMERLGLGPDVCMKRNPKLVFGRMTGWGQTGPLSHAAGHDINYISLTGSLAAIGRKNEKPVPPLNLVGDYGGGAMFLVTGVLAALLEAKNSGNGQVVDAAMTDGSALLLSMFNTFHNIDMWKLERESNVLDGAAHFYDTYETADNKYVSIGSIEPQFYQLLVEKAELDSELFADQHNVQKWPEYSALLTDVFKAKTRDEWCDIMEGSDVCFAPVLDFIEAQQHPHNVARETYQDVDGMKQPAPAPRFSRTPSEISCGAKAQGIDTDSVLSEMGLTAEQIRTLRDSGALT